MVLQKDPKVVIASPGPALEGYIRNEQVFVIARSASDEAISAVSDLTRLLHPPRRIRNDSSSCFIRGETTLHFLPIAEKDAYKRAYGRRIRR
jgi:hypothetical protein